MPGIFQDTLGHLIEVAGDHLEEKVDQHLAGSQIVTPLLPERPVKTIRLLRGSVRSKPFRLFWRTPRMTMLSCIILLSFQKLSGEGKTSRFRAAARLKGRGRGEERSYAFRYLFLRFLRRCCGTGSMISCGSSLPCS